MRTALSIITSLIFTSSALQAQTDDSNRLFDALGMDRIIGIMAQEGAGHGAAIEEQLFPGRGGAAWQGVVAATYDSTVMEQTVRGAFGSALDGTDLDPLLVFFASDAGARLVSFEIAAREAFLNDDVEDAAKDAGGALARTDPDRHALLAAFIETNDLIEQNVMGAMNSNYAFYTGLADGGAFDRSMTEEQILRDVWAQEAEIRADTTEWIFGYLGLAYGPVPLSDIEAYLELSKTPEGAALNAALFSSFDTMYTSISYALGGAAARFLMAEDL